MEQLIPIINKLQDVFNAIGQSSINLPQIVVIGSQSSGKSSVLEKIVGRDFLPRGTGIVTRRPLILQLYNISTINNSQGQTLNEETIKDDESEGEGEKGSSEEWGEFLHREGVKFHDFNDIRREIEKETERLTGKNKGISNKSINLKIYSPHVLNLTLVDLPGITKVPVGDQPSNIEDQIREMCLRFISNPNSIILAVTAANTDLANSDALKMARDIDKEGVRTMGVLTKLDLMDEGTDALDMLQGRVIPLKRGFVGVVNRSQRDILNHLPIRQSNAKERMFFESHAVYGQMPTRLGTEYLSKSLNRILMHHIRDCLPEIKSRINAMVVELDQELQEMGKSTTDMSTTELGATLLQLLSSFATHFGDALEGRAANIKSMTTQASHDMEQQLYGGARIHYIFNDIFSVSLQAVNPFDNLSDDDIRTTIRNANGPRQSLFVPEVSFELLAKRQIARLQAPGLQCVELVFDEMQRVMSQCEISMDLSRFGSLRDRVVEVVNSMLRASLAPTQQMINNLIQIELAYINTSHPDFIGGSRAVHLMMEKFQSIDQQPQQHRSTGSSNSSSSSKSGHHQSSSQYAGKTGSSGPGAPVAAAASVDYSNNNVPPQSDESQQQQYGRMTSFLFNKSNNSSSSKKQSSSNATSTATPGHSSNEKVVQLPQVPMTIMRQGADYCPSDRENIETDIIKSLLASYFNIVRKNYLDLVPKTIMSFMVNHSKDNLQNELVSNLYKEGMLSELLRETSDVSTRRATCDEMRVLLQRALDIVNEVRDFNTFQ